MFEHRNIDGEKYRVLPAPAPYTSEVLEAREPHNGKTVEQVGRLQHTVIAGTLTSRYLPSVNVGDRWPHDDNGPVWWEVVGHPPHGGIVAAFNQTFGGAYPRVLNPQHQVVAYAENGEEVLLAQGTYRVVRETDKQALDAKSLIGLRGAYYASAERAA